MSEQALCELCGEPMPEGETMFKFHGYSGPCPKPPKLVDRPSPPSAVFTRQTYGAMVATRVYMATGRSFFGCALIDREVFEVPSFGGDLIRVPPCWERQETWEVDANGDAMKINR